MLRMAASWRVKLVAKPVGSAAYSARARRTQRSMVAALLISTSSAMDPSFPLNVGEQLRPCRIEFGLVAEYARLVSVNCRIDCPPTLAGGQDSILHHRRCGAKIE